MTYLVDSAMVAATAIRYDLTLLTGNRPHFVRITGLKLYQAS